MKMRATLLRSMSSAVATAVGTTGTGPKNLLLAMKITLHQIKFPLLWKKNYVHPRMTNHGYKLQKNKKVKISGLNQTDSICLKILTNRNYPNLAGFIMHEVKVLSHTQI